MPAASTPGEVHRLFAESFVAGDVDAVVSLYEPSATLLFQPGEEPARGTEAIRQALDGFLSMFSDQPRFDLEVGKVLQAGDDLALVISKWTMRGDGQDGERSSAPTTRRRLPTSSDASPLRGRNKPVGLSYAGGSSDTVWARGRCQLQGRRWPSTKNRWPGRTPTRNVCDSWVEIAWQRKTAACLRASPFPSRSWVADRAFGGRFPATVATPIGRTHREQVCWAEGRSVGAVTGGRGL